MFLSNITLINRMEHEVLKAVFIKCWLPMSWNASFTVKPLLLIYNTLFFIFIADHYYDYDQIEKQNSVLCFYLFQPIDVKIPPKRWERWCSPARCLNVRVQVPLNLRSWALKNWPLASVKQPGHLNVASQVSPAERGVWTFLTHSWTHMFICQ